MSDSPVIGTLRETSFDDAESSFKDFLEGQGFVSDLLWVFREDVIIAGGDVFIRLPISTRNRDRARACFELGKVRDFGLKFHAFATLDGASCAYISMPKDDLDAQYKLMGNQHLKYSHTTPMPRATAVSNFISWNVRQLVAKHPRVVRGDDEVPSRITLLPPGY